MLALLAALVLAGAPPPDPWLATPDDVWTAAFLSLNDDTAPEDRPYSRYLWAPDDTSDWPKVIAYAINATSFRSEPAHVEQLGGRLCRIDLRSIGWDFPSRVKRLAELERRGVRFDAARLADLRDPWETLARADPYFVADHDDNGTYHRGWVDRNRVNAARGLSRSLKPVLRADFFVSRALTEKGQGGIYSDALLLPAKESDFYKAFLIDVDAVSRDNALLHGGAVLQSLGVAQNNRELQLLPSFYGHGGSGYGWRTLDVNTGAQFVKNVAGGLDPKSVTLAFRGTIVHDGRESLWTLPNGLLLSQLYNNSSGKAGGTGDRVDSVPDNIAQVHTPLLPVKDTRVVGGYKCMECHTSGIKSFDDVIRRIFLNKPTPLAPIAASKYAADEIGVALDEYYASDLGKTIAAQQVAYLARLRAACDMDGVEAAKEVVGAVENYIHDHVTPEAVAREMGFELDLANLGFLASRNPQLKALAAGEPLARTVVEEVFGDAMRATIDIKRAIGKGPKPPPN